MIINEEYFKDIEITDEDVFIDDELPVEKSNDIESYIDYCKEHYT